MNYTVIRGHDVGRSRCVWAEIVNRNLPLGGLQAYCDPSIISVFIRYFVRPRLTFIIAWSFISLVISGMIIYAASVIAAARLLALYADELNKIKMTRTSPALPGHSG